MTDLRQFATSAQRNRDVICDALAPHWPDEGTIVEIASGSGEHVIRFAAAAPHLRFQPSDPSAQARQSIDAWVEHEGLRNISAAANLDVTAPDWPVAEAAMIFCANMIHIAPWRATLGLMAGAGRTLRPGGMLWLYGPFIRDGVETVESNLEFDRWLRQKDPAFGIRHLREVSAIAAGEGLACTDLIEMPANNCLVRFDRS